MNKSIEKSWFFLASIIVCIVIICTIAYAAFESHKSFKEAFIAQVEGQMLSTVKTSARQIEDFLQRVKKDLKTGTEMLSILGAEHKKEIFKLPPRVKRDFYSNTIFNNFDERVDSFYILNSEGTVLDIVPFEENNIGENKLGMQGVEHVKKTLTPYVSNAFKIASKDSSISIIHPVFEGEEFIGMMRAVIYTRNIYKYFLQPVKIGESGYLTFLDNSGLIYYHPNKDFIGKNLEFLCHELPAGKEHLEEEMVKEILSGSEGTKHAIFDEFSDKPMSFAWTYISTNPVPSGAVRIKIKITSKSQEDQLMKKARLVASEIDRAIPRFKDLMNQEKLDKIIDEIKSAYPDVMEVTIYGPKSDDDDSLISKVSTNQSKVGALAETT